VYSFSLLIRPKIVEKAYFPNIPTSSSNQKRPLGQAFQWQDGGEIQSMHSGQALKYRH
jgi:hypothetical protein